MFQLQHRYIVFNSGSSQTVQEGRGELAWDGESTGPGSFLSNLPVTLLQPWENQLVSLTQFPLTESKEIG